MHRPGRRTSHPALIATLRALLPVMATALAVTTAHAAPPCGAWQFVGSPAPSGGARLYAADALSASDVWAVGSSADAAATMTLHWDGSVWSAVPAPNPSTLAPTNLLLGVAAISQDDVWAVGGYESDGANGSLVGVQTLTEHWNGSQWDLVGSPQIAGGSSFSAVDALAADEVWAVGSRSGIDAVVAERPLAARWNGTQWSETPVPFVGNRINRLQGVSARVPGDVWAVGTWRSTSTTFHVLIEHWDGSSWSVSPTSDPGDNDQLTSVAVLAADDVWAVGERHDPVTGSQPLLMHWDGSAWTTYPLPAFSDEFNRLNAIDAASPDDIWAAGAVATVAGGPSQPLLMHWDGTTWSRVDPAPSDGSAEYFGGLTVLNACDAWAVGSYLKDGVTVPLVERLDPPGSTAVRDEDRGSGPGLLLSLEATPNPAIGRARISMVLARATSLRTEVFDVRGRRVRILDQGMAPAGPSTVSWDGRNDAGAAASPGLYFIRVTAGTEARSIRLALRR